MKSGKDIIEFQNQGIVGIAEDLQIYGGYDNYIETNKSEFDDESEVLTNSQCLQIADLMIERWNRFKDKYK